MKILSGKPQMLKEVNSSMIEQLVFENGTISKPELAKRTGLSLPTISKLVDELEKNARLSSIGRSGKGAGRKAMLYEINPNSGCILACYYQNGSYLCRLADMQNNTLYEKKFPFDSSSTLNAEKSTLRTIDALLEKASAQVKIIGIGVPGIIQLGGCIFGIPQIAVWEGFNLEKALSARYNAAIYVENGVKLSAMGYFCTQLREKHDSLVYIHVGNGIGSGIILNGQLYRGSGNFSGEIGFMADPWNQTERKYAASGGFMETLMEPLVDYATGEIRKKKDARSLKELIAILSAIAVNHVVLINPSVIVFAGKIFDNNMVEAISKRMACYLPREIIPRITYDTSTATGLEGLIQSCRGYITTGMHLVQNTGLPQRADRIAG